MSETTTGNGIYVSVEELIGLRTDASRLSLGHHRGRAQLAGGYRSAFRGRGMDFEEVRAYQPGDDIRRMDWRVTARSNRPHTKLFREERERPVLLCVDTGSSMQFGTRVAFKSVQACRSAALLGWAALQNHDRIGLLSFANAAAQSLRPANGKRALLRTLQALADASAAEAQVTTPALLNETLLRARYLARHGALIILLSDFNALDATTEPHLRALAQHNAVLAIQIYDPLETELPPPGRYTFSDGHQLQSLWTADPALRREYQAAFTRRSQYLAGLCRQYAIHRLAVSTAQSPVDMLQRHLQGTQTAGRPAAQHAAALAGNGSPL